MIYVATILWAGLIFIGSSIQGSTLPSAPDVTSFLVHFFEYTILGLLLSQAIIRKSKVQSPKFKNKVIVILIIGMLYAISDEVHQLFVLGRNFDLMDLLVDFIGLITGMFVMALKYHDMHIRKF